MNQRLKELYKNVLASSENMRWNIEDAEKFANLIISECINQLNKPEYAMNHPEDLSDYNRGWVNGRLLGIEHIEQHFRTKE